jgi:peroxiredoxin
MKIQNCISIFVLILLIVLGCKRNESPESPSDNAGKLTEINGTLRGGSGEQVFLEEMGARAYIPIDTVICDASGSFALEFYAQQVAFYVLRYAQSAYITLLMKPGESLDFTGSFNDPGSYAVKGSPGSELLRELSVEHKRSLDALGEIARQNREHLNSPDYAALKTKLDVQFDSITSGFQEYSLRFIQNNPDSPAILVALYNLYGQGLPVFDPQTDLEVYEFVDSVLMASHPELEAVRLLHSQVHEAQRIMNSNPAIHGIQKGEIAPDFVSSRPDGSELALSDLKGNYVLLSFWAGWSDPSREENTTLKRALERYGAKNLKVLQVSLDDERGTWLKAIDEDALKWDHVSDLMRWDSPVAAIYRLEKIPFNVIIDPDGRVVASDLYGEKLLSTLDNILNN